MTIKRIWAGLALGLLLTGGVHAFAANRWAKYEHEMQDPINDPANANVEAEFTFGRMRFRSPRDSRGGRMRWGTDANKSERQFIVALRRLSVIDGKAIEQVVDIGTDEIFDYPFLYAVAAGDWEFTPSEGERLGKFFERGGFLVVDDLHNENEWANFMRGLNLAMPGREYEELSEQDAIFHIVHDLDRSVQISGYNIVYGRPYERGGILPYWRALRDEQGRIVAAAWMDQDLGDAWEWADAPEYPEKLASLAFRFGVNYVTYALTH
ncbi:MAG: DUF4159 domain-containing protein [Acidobacteriota bacterium]